VVSTAIMKTLKFRAILLVHILGTVEVFGQSFPPGPIPHPYYSEHNGPHIYNNDPEGKGQLSIDFIIIK